MTNTKPTSGRLFARLIRLGRQDDAEFLANIVRARNTVANDNLPPDGMGVDSEMVMRPTIEDVRRASIKTKDGNLDDTGEMGLRFNSSGELSEWRVADENGIPAKNKDGEEIWLKPVERYRKPKGGRRRTSISLSKKNAEHARWFMTLRGIGSLPAAWVPDTRYPSFGAVFGLLKTTYDAMVRVGPKSENRDLLKWLEVHGSQTLAQSIEANPEAKVTLCKPGVAWKVDFLSGKPDGNAMATEGSLVGPKDAAETAMVSAMDSRAATETMDEALEMAIAGMTAKEIATTKGWHGKHGERKALLEIDAAIASLRRAA